MIEQGKSTVGMVCDTPHCFQDVLGESEAECFSTASGLGWKLDDGQHLCPECRAGHVPKIFGAAIVDKPVRKGEKVTNADGRVIGTALEPAAAGELASVELDPDYVADRARDTKRDQLSPEFKDNRRASGASVPGVFATAAENSAVERVVTKLKLGTPSRPRAVTKEEVAKQNLRRRIDFDDIDELFGHINMKVPGDVDN